MKYSVIVTSYNQLELLKKAIETGWYKQTEQDFEIVVADDGSNDGTLEYLRDHKIKHVTQEHQGYRLTRVFNEAVKMAIGEYIIWVAADSSPKEDYLEQLSLAVAPERIVNGLRMNVDEIDKIVSQDWRVDRVIFETDQPAVKVVHARPWELMTGNGLVLSRQAFENLGGLYDKYNEGYGKMDWDLVANGYYKGMELYWCPTAILYHRQHPEREDTDNSTTVFTERLIQFQAESHII